MEFEFGFSIGSNAGIVILAEFAVVECVEVV